MWFEPSEEERLLIDTSHEFAEKEMRPIMRECEKEGNVPDSLIAKYVEMGISALNIPQEMGGGGMGMTSAVLVLEELGWGDAGITLSLPGPFPAGYLILDLGSDEQKERFLRPLAIPDGLRRWTTLALYDEEGLNIENSSTRLKMNGNTGILTGKKLLVANADKADLWVITCTVERGEQKTPSAVVVEGRNNIEVKKKLTTVGLNTLSLYEVEFAGVEISNSNILANTELSSIKRALQKVHLFQSALVIGIARASLEYAVDYAQERTAFGKPIGQHQGLAFIIAEMGMEFEGAKLMLWKSAVGIDKGRRGEFEVKKAVCQVNDMAFMVTTNAVQVLGGHGYIQDHPVEKWMRDARALSLLYLSPQQESEELGDMIITGLKKTS